MVTDLRPGSSSSTPLYLTAHDGQIYFRATTPYGNNELHVSDGSAAGTYLLVDIGDYSSSDPFYFTSFGEYLFFRATDEMGRSEVWKSDGTAQGTNVLKTINPNYGSSPNWFIVAGDQLFFTATDPVYGSLWVTNGESSGTRMVRDISSGSSSTALYPGSNEQ